MAPESSRCGSRFQLALQWFHNPLHSGLKKALQSRLPPVEVVVVLDHILYPTVPPVSIGSRASAMALARTATSTAVRYSQMLSSAYLGSKRLPTTMKRSMYSQACCQVQYLVACCSHCTSNKPANAQVFVALEAHEARKPRVILELAAHVLQGAALTQVLIL